MWGIDKMSPFSLRILISKSMMPRCSVTFSKKTSLVESFLYKRAWNFTKRRILPLLFPILSYFWKWMTFDSSFSAAWDGRFWCISISHHDGNFFQLFFYLRILTGKRHPKIKLQRLRKIQIWTFGSLVHQINSF